MYALVSCMNVLLHLTDDRHIEQALTNLAQLVEPGGQLLLAEPVLNNAAFERLSTLKHRRGHARWPGASTPLAPRGWCSEMPRAAIASPIESRSRVSFFAWRAAWAACGLPSRKVPGTAHIVGPVLAIFDPLFLRLGAGPSGEYTLFARPLRSTR